MSNNKRSKAVLASQLEKGPLRHVTLPADLVTRIGNLADVFAEVDGRPPAEWMEDFQRDQNPEKEILIWEGMAAAYSIFTKDRSLGAEAKKEAFHLLVLRSMNPGALVLKDLPLKKLTHTDAGALLQTYANVANAKAGAA